MSNSTGTDFGHARSTSKWLAGMFIALLPLSLSAGWDDFRRYVEDRTGIRVPGLAPPPIPTPGAVVAATQSVISDAGKVVDAAGKEIGIFGSNISNEGNKGLENVARETNKAFGDVINTFKKGGMDAEKTVDKVGKDVESSIAKSGRDVEDAAHAIGKYIERLWPPVRMCIDSAGVNVGFLLTPSSSKDRL